ncbi:MAG: VCBS repeat-containing protein [Acidobacteria bacterium]|nr:VCBS repeat-containing protein [Acidobacteriota bacterium]
MKIGCNAWNLSRLMSVICFLAAAAFGQAGLPTLSVNDVRLEEGNSGTTTFGFTVTLSSASAQTVTVNTSTTDLSAHEPFDYIRIPATLLVFEPGQTTKTVNVSVIGETVPEPDETFIVNLVGPQNATIQRAEGIGTIDDDDTVISFDTPADFDGDDKSDISVFRPSNGQWWLNRSLAGLIVHTFGNSTDILTPADFTGDGVTDVAVFRPLDGSWYVLRSEDFTYFSFPFGTAGDIPLAADYDGDDRADAAVFRPSNSIWYVQRSSGGIVIEAFGAAGDRPVPADYDGDGKTDIAIFRPSAGQWWLNRSTAGVIALTFGTSSDKCVPGDYTGDGKADIAFWRPSNGDWFVLRSEDWTFYSFPYGVNGDLPVPGDYDGDGKFDAAVFRPAGATWYLKRSTAGQFAMGFGLPTDVPAAGIAP